MRTAGNKMKLLEQVPMFSACTQTELRHVAAVTQPVQVDAGAVIAREGEPGKDFFVIIKGSTDVVIGDRTVAELGPGDFFGEMGVLEKAQRNATVVAKSPMRLFVLSSWDVKRLQSSAPELLEQLHSAIEQRRAAL